MYVFLAALHRDDWDWRYRLAAHSEQWSAVQRYQYIILNAVSSRVFVVGDGSTQTHTTRDCEINAFALL